MASFRFWHRLFKSTRQQPAARPAPRRERLPLSLESLEDRTVPSTFFVANGGSDVSGGGGQGNPFASIQFAINTAQSGDTIKVAAGTYTYNAAADQLQSQIGTTAVAVIDGKQLSLLGGYTTSNWNSASPTTNVTTIDGQGQVRGVMVLGGVNATSLDFEGFTVQNGFGQPIPLRGGDGAIFGFGGGMYIDMGSEMNGPTQVLANDIFQNNTAMGANTNTTYGGTAAGGGVEDTAGVLTLTNVTFSDNKAQGGTGVNRGGQAVGAGLHAANNATVTGTNVTFTNNIATGGNSNGNGVDTTTNGRSDALGGAAAIQNSGSSMTLTNVTATSNQVIGGNASSASGSDGGGAYGGAFFGENANLTLTNATVNNNSATGGTAFFGGIVGGGAIETAQVNLTVNQATFQSNTAAGGNSNATGSGGKLGPVGGGALYLTDFANGTTTFSLTNTVISDNTVTFNGTGDTSQGGGGGGLWVQGLGGTVTQSTFANNILNPNLVYGQAILLIQATSKGSTLNLSYSIVANEINSQGQAALDVRGPGAGSSNTVTLNTNLFANNTLNDNSAGLPDPAGTFNGLSTDITAATAGFVSPGAPNFNYSLLGTSPAIKQGAGSTVTVDRLGNPRTSPTDLGAFQFQPPTVQFAQVSYEVSETQPTATITVSLNKPTDTAVTFNYATSDASALAGINYVATSGTLTIPAGQTSATFTVGIINAPNQSGSLRALLTLTNLTGDASFGTQTQAALTIDSTAESDNQRFVSSLYLNILGRPADSGGLTTYTNAINGAMNPVLPTVISYFVNSTEYYSDLVNLPTTGYFPKFLGRSASSGDLSFWVGQLQAGVTNEQVIASIVGSAEFFSKNGNSNNGFVQAAYQDILGRAADTGGLNLYVGALNAGTITRQAVATVLLTSNEYRTDLVNADFLTYLSRPTGPGDLTYWVGQLQTGATDEQLIARIGGSIEGYTNNGNGTNQWITTLYNKVLGRNPRSDELPFYQATLLSGYATERYFVAQAIDNSNEFRSNLVTTDFNKYLGRAPSSSDMTFWLGQLNAGTTDQTFIIDLVGSSEYFTSAKKGNGSNLTFLQSAFKDVLNTPLDPNSQQIYMGELTTGVSTIAVAQQLVDSTAFDSVTVTALFQKYLNRTPSGTDLSFWVGQLQAGEAIEQATSQILASGEYFLDPHPGA